MHSVVSRVVLKPPPPVGDGKKLISINKQKHSGHFLTFALRSGKERKKVLREGFCFDCGRDCDFSVHTLEALVLPPLLALVLVMQELWGS